MLSFGIVLCTYNGQRFLKQQLDSILSQTRPPDKMWIIDDVSNDDTVLILNEFISKASFKVELLINKENLGPSKSFLNGLELSDCDWTLFCDQDDVWLDKKIEYIEFNIKRTPDVSMWIHDCSLVDEFDNNLYTSFFESINLQNVQGLSKNPFSELLKRPIGLGMAMAVKTDVALKAKRPSFDLLHDEWLCWYVAVNHKLDFITKELAYYRQHNFQYTSPNALSNLQKVKNIFTFKVSIQNQILRLFRLSFSCKQWNHNTMDVELNKYLEHLKIRSKVNLLNIDSYRLLFREYKNQNYTTFSAGKKSLIKDVLSSFLSVRNQAKKPELSIFLPSFFKHPSGGIKVLYEYASQIALSGIELKLIVPIEHHNIPEQEKYLSKKLKPISGPKSVYYKIRRSFGRIGLRHRVLNELNSVRNMYPGLYGCDIELPISYVETDLDHMGKKVLGTWWENVYWLNQQQRKYFELFHLVQGYEINLGEKSCVENLYNSKNIKAICVSNWLSQTLKEKHDKGSEILLNTIDYNVFKPSLRNSKKKYRFGYIDRGSDSNKGRDILVGSLKRIVRNEKILVASYEAVDERDIDLRFDFVKTDTPQKMCDFYNQIDFLIFPSRIEGFGLPIVEALACGSIPISTPVGCIFDLYKDQSELIPNSCSVDDFTVVLQKFIAMNENDRVEFIQSKRKFFEELTLEKQTQKLLQYLELK